MVKRSARGVVSVTFEELVSEPLVKAVVVLVLNLVAHTAEATHVFSACVTHS